MSNAQEEREEGEAISEGEDENILSNSKQTISSAGMQDSDEEGEDLMKPKSKRFNYSDSDDDDEDEEDEEETEADRKFIADDDDEDDNVEGGEREGEGATRISRKEKKRRRKERKRQRELEMEQLSEDELDLINENIGRDSKKRLRKKADDDRDDVAKLFDDDDHEDYSAVAAAPAPFREAELYEDSDDLDDFIIHDGSDAEMDEDERREQILRRKKERQEFAKNLGQDHGISDSAWREIEELFGYEEYEEFLDLTTLVVGTADEDGNVESVQQRPKEIKLTDVYEPSEIASKMLTENDDIIRITDVPERLQTAKNISEEYVGPSDSELGKEASVICKTFLRDRNDIPEQALHTAITFVLKFLHRDKLEVPFIYAHRRDYFDGILQLADLWRIVDLDQKYARVDERKGALLHLIVEISKIDISITEDEIVAHLVDKIITLDDVDDTFAHIHLYYISSIEQMQSVHKKRTSRMAPWKILYFDCEKYGINDFAKLYNIQYADFVMSVTGQDSLHAPDDHIAPPYVAASTFTSSRFPKYTDVLDAAKHYIAHQLAVHPQLRAFLRRIYFTDAVVTVVPTEKGNKEIESHHPYFPFKYLKAKPIHKFVDGQFLQIIKAESDGLVTVSVKIEDEDRLIEDLGKYICNDNSSELAVAWNSVRKQIAEYAAKSILFPQTVKWLKDKLTTAAFEYVVLKCQVALEKKISMGPFMIPDSNEDSPKVLVVSWGTGTRNQPAFAVIVNENGFMNESLQMDRLLDRERQSDVNALIDFIERTQPDVIAVGGFKANTKTTLFKIIQDEVLAGKNDTKIFLVDDEVARIYMSSSQGLQDFPEKDYNRLIPYCVSIGRFVQDPTCEFAGLVNKDDDIKHIRLDPLQNLLSEDHLSKSIERSFINVVNHCGVDINAAAQFPHRAHTLKFVSGLGPRKAQAFISKIIRTGGKLESRADLVQNEICARNVFINCASFIRIRAVHFRVSYRDSLLDVLDDTRVHPEDYELARKMAADALDLDDAVLEDDDSPSQHVQELMEGDVDRLNLLLLDDYAVELEKRMHAPKRVCLNDIKAELMNPYKDSRRKFDGVSLEECFTMLTGESSETLYEGAVVSTIIARVKDNFLVVHLGSGVEGMIQSSLIDQREPLTKIFQPNQALAASVLKINYDRLTVELSARQSDVAASKPRIRFDEYFDFQTHEQDKAVTIKRKKAVQKAKRNVQHPFWHSFDYQEAEHYLASRPRGEVVIRPSTKGMDHISITWKVYDGVYKHIDVLEQNKPNDWTLGDILIINSLKYHEIDQIIAEYIDPMSRRISMIIEHLKYQRKSVQDMYRFLEEQSKTIKRTAYGFVISPDDPGAFLLCYKHISNSCKKESIVVRHNGFEFRKKLFSKVDKLLEFFKMDESKKSSTKQRSSTQHPSRAVPPMHSRQPVAASSRHK